jgi:hypothetical protein
VAGAGAESYPGSGALVLTAPTLDGSGLVVISGSGALSTARPVVSGSGLHVQDATGTGAVAMQAPTVAGAGNGGVTSIDIGGVWTGVPKPFVPPWPTPIAHIRGRGALASPAPSIRGAADNVEDEEWLLLT